MAKWGEVLDITEFTRIVDTGNVETWYRYRAISKAGVTFTASISDADATEENVDRVLREKAERLDKTKAL